MASGRARESSGPGENGSTAVWPPDWLPIWGKVAKVAKVANFFGITPLAVLAVG